MQYAIHFSFWNLQSQLSSLVAQEHMQELAYVPLPILELFLGCYISLQMRLRREEAASPLNSLSVASFM